MTRRPIAIFLAALAAASALGAKAPPSDRFKRPAPVRATPRVSLEERRLAQAQLALSQGRVVDARAALKGLDMTHLSRAKAEEAAYVSAIVQEGAADQDRLLEEYLKSYPHGANRRAATLDLAKSRYAQGDYREAENLLSIFSPGVERNRLGREGLVWRALSQLGHGDAAGALQFLNSAKQDLDGNPEEEACYFAIAQAALRANKPQEAVEALKVILAKHPRGEYAPQALYAMGISLESMGRAADATAVFRQVAQRFPDSYEATRARDRGIRPEGAKASGMPIGGGFAIQVGAFTRRDLADALAKDLRIAGVSDVSVQEGRESPPIYRVRAGAFASRDEARALGERLRRERGFSYNVVPR